MKLETVTIYHAKKGKLTVNKKDELMFLSKPGYSKEPEKKESKKKFK